MEVSFYFKLQNNSCFVVVFFLNAIVFNLIGYHLAKIPKMYSWAHIDSRESNLSVLCKLSL